ncbi:hypothetical protein HCN44_001990 [Aphidius gifuensis]|uniref:Uncharacterized protein n=1 Tax=Aphidius gifuensis TaxID=684658 RepID=A0A834XZB2_APHGI|nr:uncharacterized protein LOC122847329 [Aphidius gifuensis]KAF7996358.1 hypothetical protein HCN44_001990 [Aphidius gifuensis]
MDSDEQSIDEFEDSDSNPSTPLELCDAINSLDPNYCTLPEKSKEMYEASYSRFISWCESNNAKSFSKKVLLAYFIDSSKKYQPSTLYSEYSKLKTTIKAKHDVDISDYKELKHLLRIQSVGFVSKKGKVLSENEIKRFLNEAPDDVYLAAKVVTIFRSFGECKRDELKNITVDDIKRYYNDDDKEKKYPMIRVYIQSSNPCKNRNFTIEGEYYKYYEKYRLIRCAAPRGASREFFLSYKDGKCTRQPIGVNKFGRMPKEIAIFLGLDNPDEYTGHSKSSARLSTEAGLVSLSPSRLNDAAGADTTPSGTQQNNTSNSAGVKRKLCNQITQSINIKRPSIDTIENNDTSNKPKPPDDKPASSTKTYFFPGSQNSDTPVDITSPNGSFILRISNCTNCTFNFIEKKGN